MVPRWPEAPNNYGQCNVAPLPPGLTYVQLAAGAFYTVALRSDGSVVVWGWGMQPLTQPCVEVAAQGGHFLARMRDGSIVWMDPRNVVPALPAGVTYTGIAVGYATCAARRSDGSLVVWGGSAHGQADVPALPPGLGYVDVAGALDTVTAIVGPASTYVTFASGCAGSLPASRLIPFDTPSIGRTLRVTIDNLPLDIAIMMAGWSSTTSALGPLPLPLAWLGMPGCFLHISVDALALVVGSGGAAEHSLPIPNVPALVGAQMHQQAVVPDPAAGNVLRAVLSGAARFVVGSH